MTDGDASSRTLDITDEWRLPGHRTHIHRDIRGDVRAALASMPVGDSVLRAREIVKRFGSVVANDHVDFRLAKGEIHGLLGENGAGKTTLVKILYGLITPDSGSLEVAGVPVSLRSPQDSLRMGIGMVQQDIQLIEPLSVAENLFFGLGSPKFWMAPAMNRPSLLYAAAARVLDAGGMSEIDPRVLVGGLAIGVRQRIEILKVLMRGARILILDEPTATLTPTEVEQLFTNLDALRVKDDLSIILITHKLKEVVSACNRVTVLRRGSTVGVWDRSELTTHTLAAAVMGEERVVEIKRPDSASDPGPTILEIRGLSVRGPSGRLNVEDCNLTVTAGEIMAVAGVSGNGQTELVLALLGQMPIDGGDVALKGESILASTVRSIRGGGVAVVPEDRDREGLLLSMSIRDNMLVARSYDVTRPPFRLFNYRKLDAWVDRLISRFAVRARSPHTAIETLSGGNRQKVLLARELSADPVLVLASEPTRGLDIAAAAHARSLLSDAAQKREAGVLLFTSDLDEVLELANRVAVMYRGRLSPVHRIDDVTRGQVGALMGGAHWPEDSA